MTLDKNTLLEAAKVCAEQFERDLPNQKSGGQSQDYSDGYLYGTYDCARAIRTLAAAQPAVVRDAKKPVEIIDPPGAAVETFRRRYGRLPNRKGDQLPITDRLELAAQAVMSDTPITDKIISDAQTCPETRIVFLIDRLANQCKEFERALGVQRQDNLIEKIKYICVKAGVSATVMGAICHEVRHAPIDTAMLSAAGGKS